MQAQIQRSLCHTTLKQSTSIFWPNGTFGLTRLTIIGAFTTELGHYGQDGLEEKSSNNGQSTQFTASGWLSTRAGMCICEEIMIYFNSCTRTL